MRQTLPIHRFFTTILFLAVTTLTWAYDFAVDGIYYDKNADGTSVTVTYTSWDRGYSGSVVIPSTVTYSGKTYSVTGIGSSAFLNCTGLTSVTIPNSVTSIGDYAFRGCSGLTKAEFASIESLCKIKFSYDSNPLYYAKHLYINGQEVTDVVIPNSITSINDYTFRNCSSLKSVTIPNSVTSIGEGAFRGCSGLTSVTIPNSVTSIDYYAFSGCSGLKSVTIPNSVTSIGYYAFSGCSGLTKVTCHAQNVPSTGTYAFYNVPSTATLYVPAKSINAYKSASPWSSFGIIRAIGEVEDFSVGGIYYHTNPGVNTAYVTYKDTDYNSYSGAVVIPSTVTYRDKTYNVTGIGSSAFYGCSGLTSITIPGSVKRISDKAFYNCYGLKSAIIGSGVISIGFNAFYSCGFASLSIPNSVKSIGERAFDACSELKYIAIGNSVDSICENAFRGTAWYKSQPDGLIYAGKVLYEYKGTMPSGTRIVIKEGTLGIAERAFIGRSNLIAVSIPNTVKTICSTSFSGCSGLKSVTIPASIVSIETLAFSGCSGLKSVICRAQEVPSTGISAFESVSQSTVTLYVPAKSIDKYKSTDPWKNFGTIMYIAGTNDFPIDSIYYKKNTDSTSVTVTSQQSYSPYNYSDSYYGSVTIPSAVIYDGKKYDVTGVSNNAFYGCIGLTSVTIPESVTNIGSSAFRDCTCLKSVTIPNSVAIIESNTFLGCFSLTSITIPGSVRIIDKSAFSGCSGLKSVTISNSVTSIGEYAFSDCSGLTSLTIPNSVTSIGNYAFEGCALQTIINHGDNDIAKDVFSDRVYLHTQLYVPEGTVWDYIFNTGWGEFHHIKEFATSADDIRNDAVYMIADRSGRNFPVYDKSAKTLKKVAYTLNLDDSDTGACWQVIRNGSDTYLYNIGAGMYAAYDADDDLSLSIVPTALAIDMTEDGATIDGKPVMLVANKSVTPIDNPTGIDTLQADEAADTATQTVSHDDTAIYDLNGRRLHEKPAHGFYIQGGKKVMIK